jgi:hypothetical protein
MKESKEFKYWNRLYWLQMVVLGLLIGIFFWLTEYFS